MGKARLAKASLFLLPKRSMYRDRDHFLSIVYDRYWEPLYVYAQKMTRHTAQTEDIIQEVFIDIWKRYDSIEILHLESYLYTATKYRCFDYLRRRPYTLTELEFAYEAMEEYGVMTAEERELFQEQLLQKIRLKATELLPPKCLEVFRLRYLSQKSYKEISEILHISEHTVKNQLHKALSILREQVPYSVEAILFFMFLT